MVHTHTRARARFPHARRYPSTAPHYPSRVASYHPPATVRYDGWKRFTTDKHPHLPEDSRAFLEFMDWIHFYDDILEACSDALAAHLVADIITRFFVAQIVRSALFIVLACVRAFV